MNKKNSTTGIILNVILFIFTVIGIILMLTGDPESGNLQASGIENFKFYTVLSNVYCGLVSAIYLIFALLKKNTEKIRALKLSAVCGVTITFAVVAFMFGPLYGWLRFYTDSNLFFHLLEPVVALVEFLIVRREKMPLRYAVFAAIPTLLYAIGYMLNILINGIGGPWPYTNDFYGFLNWGWGGGIAIFFGVPLLSFGIACIFRAVSNKRTA